MQIKLKFVSQTYDRIEGVMIAWRVYRFEGDFRMSDAQIMSDLQIKEYPIKDGLATIDSPDGHAILLHVQLVLERRGAPSVKAMLETSKEFTDQELVAGEARINMDDDFREVLLRVVDPSGQSVPGAKISLKFLSMSPTMEVDADENGERLVIAPPGEFYTSVSRVPGVMPPLVMVTGDDPPRRVVVLTKA